MGEADLRVRLTDLRRHPGDRTQLSGGVDLAGLAVSTATVTPGTGGELEAVLESLSDGVTARGTIRFDWTGDCRRCLEPTTGSATAEFHEVFKDDPHDPSGGGDLLAVEGDVVDLGPVVREAVVLALPLAPLCRDDCPGPDPEHFPVALVADDAEPPVDPRWAALAEIEFDSTDGDS